MTDRGREEAERIADRCPSCGGQTLFIGKGGWLTCSLIGCEIPPMNRAIQAALSRAREAGIEEMRGRAAKATCYLCNQLYPVKRNDFTFYHEGLGICQATAILTLAARGGEDNATQ